MNNGIWVYKELEALKREGKLSDDIIMRFDCGNDDMSDYLHYQASKDVVSGDGVTYVLVRRDEVDKDEDKDESKKINRIYAYATIKAHSLSYYESGEKYHAKEVNEQGQVLSSIPCVEIKMFAIDRALKKQPAYNIDNGKHHYSTLFFMMFLEDLYYMSMNTIGFKVIFLRANDEGEKLYRNVGFIDSSEYLQTYDSKAEGCISLFLTLRKLEEAMYS